MARRLKIKPPVMKIYDIEKYHKNNMYLISDFVSFLNFLFLGKEIKIN